MVVCNLRMEDVEVLKITSNQRKSVKKHVVAAVGTSLNPGSGPWMKLLQVKARGWSLKKKTNHSVKDTN